jgi:hypothetical protein
MSVIKKKSFVTFDYWCKFITDGAASNCRLAWKNLQGTTTLAFCAAMSLIKKKRFVTIDYKCKCYETFFFITDGAKSNCRLAWKDL